ncbi:MAG: hypothetical protein AAF125_15925, partial [Chloroflexota bacterium]
DRMMTSDRVWLMMPSNHPETWFTAAALMRGGRMIGYADGVQNMLVYRLDADGDQPLTLAYGTLDRTPLAVFDGPIVNELPNAVPGETITYTPPLDLLPDAASVGVSVSLVRGYNTVIDQWSGAPGEAGSLTLPDDALGDYLLYVTLTDRAGRPLPVWHDEVWWGNWIVAARLAVPPTE